jgi:hypothetical protein
MQDFRDRHTSQLGGRRRRSCTVNLITLERVVAASSRQEEDLRPRSCSTATVATWRLAHQPGSSDVDGAQQEPALTADDYVHAVAVGVPMDDWLTSS